jgi:hypothetical protein
MTYDTKILREMDNRGRQRREPSLSLAAAVSTSPVTSVKSDWRSGGEKKKELVALWRIAREGRKDLQQSSWGSIPEVVGPEYGI